MTIDHILANRLILITTLKHQGLYNYMQGNYMQLRVAIFHGDVNA